MEFIQCTLADGHFCVLNTGLYHIDCPVFQMMTRLTFIAGSQANYLDQGLWAISVEEPIPMEVKCKNHSHVKTLETLFTLINLQPACSAFSSVIKLPPYFKRFSMDFHVALKSANLHIPKFSTPDFRIWTHFNLSNVTKPKVYNLRKPAPASKIPITQLRA